VIHYAVPSYRRAETCKARTVATLSRLGVPESKIDVFVADEQDEREYKKVLPKANVIRGVPGLINQRRFYNAHYGKGEKILNVDDDLYDLKFLNSAGKLSSYAGDIGMVAEYAFRLCESTGAKLWGISAVENGFYMKRSSSAGLRYICGIFHGSYAGDPALCSDDRPLVSSGEDFETTLRSFRRYGVVVRLDWLCPKTKYFAPGGMQAELGGSDELRQKDHAKELAKIAERHAGLCSLYKKSGGVTNLRLKTIKSTAYPISGDLLPKE
jgi:hypothetical protein